MCSFLRIISLLIIIFASLSLAMAADDPKPALTVVVTENNNPKPTAPWILVRKDRGPSIVEGANDDWIVFSVRGDLPSNVKATLRKYANTLQWGGFESVGVWVQNSDLDRETFGLYSLRSLVPSWMVNRLGTALVFERLRLSYSGRIHAGGFIAGFESNKAVYPRRIKSHWTFLTLLHSHSFPGRVHDKKLGWREHPGSKSCKAYLKAASYWLGRVD